VAEFKGQIVTVREDPRDAAVTGVSAATLTRTRAGGRLEVDGMLARVRWLGVPVETFVRESKRSTQRSS